MTSVSFDTPSRRVLTAGDDQKARIWSPGLVRLPGPANTAAFDPTGKRVVTTGENGFSIWDAGTGRRLRTIPTGAHPEAAALNPGGTLAATAEATRVRLWNVATRKQMPPALFRGRPVRSVAFDGHGVRLLAALDEAAGIVDIRDREHPRTFPWHAPLNSAALSDDTRLIVAASDRGAVVWRVNGSHPSRQLGGGKVDAAEFNRDGTLVVTAGPERAVIWKRATKTRLRSLDQPSVYRVAFSPDGLLVVAGSDDGLAQVWDWRAPRQLTTLSRAGNPSVTSASFSADGTKILLALGQAGVALYDCAGCGSEKELVRAARRRISTG